MRWDAARQDFLLQVSGNYSHLAIHKDLFTKSKKQIIILALV
jgi:hypothetical protein